MAVIKDVAKLAGVSVGTVSKYLNTPDLLKEDKRAAVEDAIQKLNYKPNLCQKPESAGFEDNRSHCTRNQESVSCGPL